MSTTHYLSETLTLQLEVSKCNGCGMCMTVCPHGVFKRDTTGKAAYSDREACMECGACSNNCSQQAITVRSGVGCAAGVLNGLLRGGDYSCGDGTGSACC